MEIELKRPEKIKIKLDGEVYELEKIRMGEVIGFENEVQDKGISGTVAFLVRRGMPEAVVLSLETELVQEILEHLKPKKKD